VLRALVVLLALANLGFWSWQQGWLGTGPAAVASAAAPAPIHPERFTLIVPGAVAASAAMAASTAMAGDAASSAAEAASAPASAAALAAVAPSAPASAASAPEPALACLEAGPFDEQRWVAAQAALRSLLPAGRWTERPQPVPGRWIVYMGRYGDAAALERKETELRRIPSIQFERVNAPPGLAPGLSLGAFEDAGGAQAALQRWAQRGIRTARVVNLVPPQTGVQVRVDRLPPDLQAQLLAQRNAALGKGFVSCKAAG
jgi:hypothetical protein